MNHKGTFLLAIATVIVALTSAINTDDPVRNSTRPGNFSGPLLNRSWKCTRMGTIFFSESRKSNNVDSIRK